MRHGTTNIAMMLGVCVCMCVWQHATAMRNGQKVMYATRSQDTVIVSLESEAGLVTVALTTTLIQRVLQVLQTHQHFTSLSVTLSSLLIFTVNLFCV